MLKRMRHKEKGGFSTLEYTVLVAVLAAALLAAQVFLTRAVSRRWRDAGDAFGGGRQYEQGKTVIF